LLKDKLPSSRTFPDDSSSFYTDTQMLDWLHFAERDVQTRLIQTFENWFVTSTIFDIIEDLDEYALPSGCVKIIRLEDIEDEDNPIEIYPMSFNDKDKYTDRYDINVTANGHVYNYVVKGNDLILRPVPTRDISSGARLYYERRVTAYTCGSMDSEIPVEYQDLLVWNIVEYGFAQGEATPEALTYAIGKRRSLERLLATSGENRQVQRSRYVKRTKRRF
jgi:hypothetical protein